MKRTLALASILAAAIGFAFTSGASAAACVESGLSTSNPCTFQGITFSLTPLSSTVLEVTFAPETGNSIEASASGNWTGIQFLEAFSLIPATANAFTSATINNAAFSPVPGGINSNAAFGCNGSGAGICFTAGATPFAIPDTGNMVFDVTFTGTSANFNFFPTTHLKVAFFLTAEDENAHGSLLSTDIPVPGPIVGAGLPALLIACGGLLGLARRRRQRTA